MGIDIDDKPVFQAALDGVAFGVRQHVAGIGVDVDLLNGREGGGDLVLDVHDRSPTLKVSSSGRRRYQSASSIGPRCNARSISDTADSSSVGVISESRWPAIGENVRSSPSVLAT